MVWPPCGAALPCLLRRRNSSLAPSTSVSTLRFPLWHAARACVALAPPHPSASLFCLFPFLCEFTTRTPPLLHRERTVSPPLTPVVGGSSKANCLFVAASNWPRLAFSGTPQVNQARKRARARLSHGVALLAAPVEDEATVRYSTAKAQHEATQGPVLCVWAGCLLFFSRLIGHWFAC